MYEASAGGSNADGAAMFNALGPKRETVMWGRGGNIRLETVGGMREGIVIVRLADSAIYTLDPAAGSPAGCGCTA